VEVAIPNIEGLHRQIAQSVTAKRGRLTGAEVRFLRKWLGLSGVDFAQHMGVSAETVSRWEQSANPIGTTADRLLRWLVVTREPVSEYPLELLKHVAREKPRPIKLAMRIFRGRWQSELRQPALAAS
jgi:DNA-binding transcriptional regulator YiaG